MKSAEGMVLWFTGLSGSGKTTTAREVTRMLRESGRQVELLDGDEMRETICKGLGFSREDRLENIKRITFVAALLAKHGVIVIVSAITPYQEMRDYARSKIDHFVEIHVDCPLEECERRDVKGLYAKARKNEISKFTGISDPYERPVHAEITINTQQHAVENNAVTIMVHVEEALLAQTSEHAAAREPAKTVK